MAQYRAILSVDWVKNNAKEFTQFSHSIINVINFMWKMGGPNTTASEYKLFSFIEIKCP